MTKVICDHCGKFLFETNAENKGAIASEAKHKGYVVKLPILYGITNGFKIFCCSDCYNTWFDEHVSPEQKEEGEKSFNELKNKLTSPEFTKGLQDGLTKIQNLFNKFKKS